MIFGRGEASSCAEPASARNSRRREKYAPISEAENAENDLVINNGNVKPGTDTAFGTKQGLVHEVPDHTGEENHEGIHHALNAVNVLFVRFLAVCVARPPAERLCRL